MQKTLVHVYRFNQVYAHRLLEGVPDDQMVRQPVPKMNHPAWIIGHLAVVADRLGHWIGGEPGLPESWNITFGKGSVPQHDASAYPGKAELVEAFDAAHDRLVQAYENADSAVLASPNDRVRKEHLPTRHDVIAFVMTAHDSVHLGQLSAWRRVAGLPGVL